MKHLMLGLAGLALAVTAHAAELGDDGLHKAGWMRDTFKDLGEDLEEATANGQRLLVIVEQRGCIYCTKMHEEVFIKEDIAQTLNDDYFVVQINMFGDVEVTDFDGETLSEKEAVRKWGALFTPYMMFFPEESDGTMPADDLAVATMPGAFGPATTRNLLAWVQEKGYEKDEPFQKYHARKFEESKN